MNGKTLFLLNLLSFFLFFVLFFIINGKTTGDSVPTSHILIVSILFELFYMLFFKAIWLMFEGDRNKTYFSIAILFSIIIFYKYCSFNLIYSWLPAGGVELYNKSVPFNQLTFNRRILRFFMTAFLFAGVSVYLFRTFWRAKVNQKEDTGGSEEKQEPAVLNENFDNFIVDSIGNEKFRMLVETKQLCYASLNKSILEIYSMDRDVIKSYKTLKEFMNCLPSEGFLRISANAVIAKDKIIGYSKKSVVIRVKDGEKQLSVLDREAILYFKEKLYDNNVAKLNES